MPTKDEDLTLVSLLSAHPADAMPYVRLPFFLDLFPTRKLAAKWVADFWEQNKAFPKLALLKKHFPAVQTLQQVEPLRYCYDILRQQYIDTIAATAGEKMTDALDKRDMTEFIKHNTKLTDLISAAEKPLSALAEDSNTFIEQLGLELDRDAAEALKVMATGFTPIDDEDGGGLRPGHIYILSSIVNLGKTYVSLTLAERLRAKGYRVLYASTEMPKDDLMLRAFAVRFKMNVDQVVKREQPQSSKDRGETREAWYKRLLQEMQTMIDKDTSTGKLFIKGDETILTPREIAASIKEHSVDAVFIDAAQDIRDNNMTKERTPALYNAVSELNILVKTLRVSLFATVQLDSEVEKKGLIQGNLNRIQWAQVFAQKAHVVMSMLGSRDSDFRDMTIDKSRDGKAGRKFWLTFKFPEVDINATTKTPGTLADLDPNAAPAETVSELEKALAGMSEPATPSGPTTPAPARMPPKRAAVEEPQEEPAQPAEEGTSSYQRRQQERAAKKKAPPWRNRGK